MGKWSNPSSSARDTQTAVEQRLFGRGLTDDERAVLGHRVGWVGPVLTQEEVASRLGVSQPTVSNIERRLRQRMKALRKAEQGALEQLPESRALREAEAGIREALDKVEAVRRGDFTLDL